MSELAHTDEDLLLDPLPDVLKPKRKKKDRATPVHVASFGTASFELAFVSAFAKACREGIPARLLATDVAVQDIDGELMLVRDHASTDVTALRDRIRTQEIRRDNATQIIRDLPPDANELMETWLEVQRSAVQRLAKHRAALVALETGADREMPARLEVFADVIERVLANLVTLRGKQVSPAKQRALATILEGFEVVPEGEGMLRCSTSVLMAPPGGGLALLGPFEFTVSSGGTAAATSRQRVKSRSWHPTRKQLRDRLEVYPRLSPRAVLKLLNSPFPELALTVLNRLDPVSHPFPNWVHDDWRQAPFGKWVERVYTSADIASDTKRVRGQHSSHSAMRQLAAYFAASRFEESELRLGPNASARKVLEDSQFSRADFSAWLDAPLRATADLHALRDSRSAGWFWHAPVDNNGLVTQRRRFFSVLCRKCRRPATLAVRTPEIPRDLLCGRCMVMPTPLYGMPAAVKFPEAYRDLGRPLEVCLNEIRSSTRHLGPLPPLEQRILSMESLLSEGATSVDLIAALGEDGDPVAVRSALRALEAKHLLGRDLGTHPIVYRNVPSNDGEPRSARA